jgi:hypothetical protein
MSLRDGDLPSKQSPIEFEIVSGEEQKRPRNDEEKNIW